MLTFGEKFYRARLSERFDFARDLWLFRIDVGERFDFTPGQFATLGLEVDGKRIERPYSIASSPWESELEFFLELVPEGKLTPLLHKLQPGDEMLMRKIPKGKFTLETGNGRHNHLLVSTVTGVAPFVSYVRSLAQDWKQDRFDGSHRLYLLNGASHPWEFGYKDELMGLAGDLPWLTYVPTVSRPRDHADWQGETGRADCLLEKYLDAWDLDRTNTRAYLCGHPDMIANSKTILKRRGFVDRADIKEETYWIAPRPAAASNSGAIHEPSDIAHSNSGEKPSDSDSRTTAFE
jgi:ferredoxin/flavodoxin---NADP+ reductase